ncbi:MAG TPA: diphthine synthase [Nitrososphaerales archaeon]|nr:diphthine synthase [Nitrososphaerales archaeon]
MKYSEPVDPRNVGKLTFVGLGLGTRGVSLEGLEELKAADIAYLEYYTTPYEPTLPADLEKLTGRRITVVDRGFVENGREILKEAREKRVALAVPGDPMVATTHAELRTRATMEGTETRVVHAATIGTAAASASGLHFYKFSRTVTITRGAVGKLSQVYQILHENLLQGAHTLLLLEHDVESGEGVGPSEAAAGLLAAEENFKLGVVGEETFSLVLSRVGRRDQALRAAELGELRGADLGAPPHCVVIPGKLHFTEVDSIAAAFGVEKAAVHGNSDGVKRTAQTLVPKYVAKTRRALESVRQKLGPKYASVVENVELYLKDADNFLANDEDEMAMLSVGYAEGLLDSLSFAGVVKIDW